MSTPLPTYRSVLEPLAVACIGAGVAATLAAKEFDPADTFGSREAMLACVLAHADAISVEWGRRYGSNGAYPGRFDNDRLLELVGRFGRFYARALIRDSHAHPQPVMRHLFNELDPDFKEPSRKNMPDSGLLVLADFQDDVGIQIWRAGVFDNEEDAKAEWEAWRSAVCPAAELVGFQMVTVPPQASASR